jgi:DNA-directed RNA polymerase specialized sigma24 family protein
MYPRKSHISVRSNISRVSPGSPASRSRRCASLGHRLGPKRQAPSRRRLSDPAVNRASFEQFLAWLGPDPDTAGRHYELIRQKLITIFKCRGCTCPEDLADATFDRVSRKLPEIQASYSGEPARYFYGVAKKIYLEHRRQVPEQPLSREYAPSDGPADQRVEHMLECIDLALSTLQEADRELILSYYSGTGQERINARKALAQQLGLPLNALRLRMFRIRSQIRDYVLRLSPENV